MSIERADIDKLIDDIIRELDDSILLSSDVHTVIRDSIKRYLSDRGIKSSGSLIDSIEVRYEEGLVILANDYFEYLDKGVSGTSKTYNTPYSFGKSMPNVESIRRWMTRKGIEGNAYAIGKSIQREGIRPRTLRKDIDMIIENILNNINL